MTVKTLLVFGVCFDRKVVIMHDGKTFPVKKWCSITGRECGPEDARAVLFQGPGGVHLGVDLKDLHVPTVQH